jgi:hypothetical protein
MANWEKTEAKMIKNKINWMDWVYGTGLAPEHLSFYTSE